ncbi:DNA polymerase II [Psychrobium sp. 1_MG-2023]|uniref:DNA polymerase II n=1 Tax=Psychrobium sp. 1_MG-2023 TaxID=3062624 RepID=UPI000C328A0C|nr:DNA polymerase II [Psychrobium sp. 1_MG-2023]MDP2562769.1 DNA polymerase II [Psychrobium sp. 1_MG-2023]PKF57778.1 DNA polymerase II [Alteromonadales bacterium alter-6D02]
MNTSQHGFLLTQQSVDIAGKAQIELWLATPQGPAQLIIEGQQPVFFIAQQDIEQASKVLHSNQIQFRAKPLALTTFEQQPVTALYFNSISHSRSAAYQLKQSLVKQYENDFRLDQRFLMERFICGGIEFSGQHQARLGYDNYQQVKIRPSQYTPTLTTLSLDIECSERGELYSIGLDLNHHDYQKVIMIGPAVECEHDYVHWVDDEAQLLEQLEREIAATDPDIIVGWNVINFDFRLLVKRAQYHGKKLRLGRGDSFVHWRESNVDNNGYISIPGRVVVDGIDALKSATYHFASFSLDFVANALLNRGKISENVHNRMAEINHNFRHDKPALAAYNLEDCRLVNEIFNHIKLLDYLIFRSKLTGLLLDRVGGSVAAFTNLYLPKLHRAGYVAPNLPPDGGLASPGGYVMDSKPGLYENVLVLDFKSLYPSIIRTFKIDPMGLIEGLKHPEQAIEGFKKAKFSRQQHFLPQIITDLWQQRDQAKKDQDSARSQAIKIIMNSFYGVLGSGGCRFYDTRLASSITMRGHQIIQQTAQWIEEKYQVIYGDTDSVFVLVGDGVTNEQANQIGRELAQDINQRWVELLRQEHQLECQLELEFETLYQRFLMPTIRGSDMGSKKRYAGLLQKGDKTELIFKGLENVRTDWTELARDFQHELYRLVFDQQDPRELVLSTVEKVKQGELDDKLIYSKRLRRNLAHYVKNVPPQVKAARIADEKNAELGRPLQYQNKGVISYVITVNGPEPVDYTTSPIDYQHYIDKQLEPVADGILPFIDLTFNQITDIQMGLF